MSFDALRYAFDRLRDAGNTADRLTLLTLANHANRLTHEAYPSTRTLAVDSGLSERQVRRSLGRLVTAGLIAERQERQDRRRVFFIPPKPDTVSGLNGKDVAPKDPDVSGQEVRFECGHGVRLQADVTGHGVRVTGHGVQNTHIL